MAFLNKTPGSGIIYASTRKRAEEVAQFVAERTGRRTAVYHAGMLPEQRKKAQEDFMRGRCEIVVATNAFGMGIDKADVRFVVHYNIPGSVEAYYQEAGRAGRDGQLSHCLMLFHFSDKYIQEYFIDSSYPDREHVRAVHDFLREREENPIEMTQDEVKQTLGLPIGADGVGNCEQLLESAGVLERMIASQNMATVRIDSDLPTLVDLLPKQAKTQRKVIQSVERLVGARRQELVQFRIRDLSVFHQLDQTSLNRALHELNRLQSFTYLPPFRGRAIRMIRRDLEFERLEIDFEAIERRKQVELDKLERVIRFAQGGTCRQREILLYFGEENPANCGHCDNCRLRGIESGRQGAGHFSDQSAGDYGRESEGQGAGRFSGQFTGEEPEVSAAPLDGKVLEAVRMVLSGVARVQARKFSCGKNLIAKMLCGSNDSKIKKLRLDKLSTFGLLQHLKQQEVLELIDALFAERCLQQVDIDRFRPVVELTEFGGEVMRGTAVLNRRLPLPESLLLKLRGQARSEERREKREERREKRDAREEKASAGAASADAAVELPHDRGHRGPLAAEAASPANSALANAPDPAILEALKQWREAVADEAGVPAYYILTNDTLAELARHRPGDRETLRSIRGIGPAKVERYGAELLLIVGEGADGQRAGRFSGQSDVAEGLGQADKPSGESDPPDSRYWTRRLLSAGFSIEECMAIRGLPRATIEAHARDDT